MTVAAGTVTGLAARAVGATKRFGAGATAVTALDDISVDIRRGRFTAIMGPSGSGKSTLMHALAGLDTVDSGTVWIGETQLNTLSDSGLADLRRNRVGFVFQQFNLLPTLSAEENILLPSSPVPTRTSTSRSAASPMWTRGTRRSPHQYLPAWCPRSRRCRACGPRVARCRWTAPGRSGPTAR